MPFCFYYLDTYTVPKYYNIYEKCGEPANCGKIIIWFVYLLILFISFISNLKNVWKYRIFNIKIKKEYFSFLHYILNGIPWCSTAANLWLISLLFAVGFWIFIYRRSEISWFKATGKNFYEKLIAGSHNCGFKMIVQIFLSYTD